LSGQFFGPNSSKLRDLQVVVRGVSGSQFESFCVNWLRQAQAVVGSGRTRQRCFLTRKSPKTQPEMRFCVGFSGKKMFFKFACQHALAVTAWDGGDF
jgi:hypothetical protein